MKPRPQRDSRDTRAQNCFAACLYLLAVGLVFSLTIAGCGSGQAPAAPTESDATPPADSIGEALFLDTRFGEFFAANMTGVNTPLATGDPVVAEVQTMNGPLPDLLPGKRSIAGRAISSRNFKASAVAGIEPTPTSPRAARFHERSQTDSIIRREMPCRWWTLLSAVQARYFCIPMESSLPEKTW